MSTTSTTGTPSGSMLLRPSRLLALVISALIPLVGCADDSRGSAADVRADQARPASQQVEDPFAGYHVGEAGTPASSYESLDDLVRQSSIVAIVDIVGQRRGAITDESHESRTTQRILAVGVGAADTAPPRGERHKIWHADIVEREAALGEAGALLVATDAHALRVGDRVLVGLVPDVHPQFEDLYGIQSPSAYFLLDENGQRFMPPGDRFNEVANDIDAMTVVRAS